MIHPHFEPRGAADVRPYSEKRVCLGTFPHQRDTVTKDTSFMEFGALWCNRDAGGMCSHSVGLEHISLLEMRVAWFSRCIQAALSPLMDRVVRIFPTRTKGTLTSPKVLPISAKTPSCPDPLGQLSDSQVHKWPGWYEFEEHPPPYMKTPQVGSLASLRASHNPYRLHCSACSSEKKKLL